MLPIPMKNDIIELFLKHKKEKKTMKINGELVTRKSKKTGNDYVTLDLTFPNGYKKIVFLETAEIFMLSVIADNQDQ